MQKVALLLCCLTCASQADPLKSTSAFKAPGMLAKNVRAASPNMETMEDLSSLASKLNPAVGYYDPLNLAENAWWGDSNEATIGWLRHAEIKHGRVAMAAFVGYCIQSNGLYWPWKLTGTIKHADIAAAGSPPEQWDALPTASKWQILLFIGFLEVWSEASYNLESEGGAHYMRGGVPGKFPTFANLPHPVPFNFYDPFKLNKKKTREQLDKSLLAELNNGRLAMLGIMAFLSEQKTVGAVPVLTKLANLKPYAGQIMAPFTADEFWAKGIIQGPGGGLGELTASNMGGTFR